MSHKATFTLKTTVAAEHAKKIASIKKQSKIIQQLEIQRKIIEDKYNNCHVYPEKTDIEEELYQLTAKIDELKSHSLSEHKYWAQAAPQIVNMCRNNRLIHHTHAERDNTHINAPIKPIIKPPTKSHNAKMIKPIKPIIKAHSKPKKPKPMRRRVKGAIQDAIKYNERDELKKYLSNTTTYISKSMKTNTSNDIYCDNCEIYRIDEDSQMVCPSCGEAVDTIKESEHISYKDPPTNSTNYNYQPLSHFKDCLTYLQAKENTDVSHVVEALEKERNRRNYSPEQLTRQIIRRWLAKAGFNKYYEHIPLIMFKMNGKKPPVMPTEIENKLCQMFSDIRESWDKHKAPDRKNMLSYPYIIYKFCELLGLAEWLPRLKMLECKTYLHSNDRVWRSICVDMGGSAKGWNYISSF